VPHEPAAPAGRNPPLRKDLRALALEQAVDLDDAMAQLDALYADLDRRNARHTSDLDLPCHRGCSMCCHESVFLTQLEFFAAWDYLQREAGDATIERVVRDALALHDEHRALIESFDRPPPEGADDHTGLHQQLSYSCPLLDDEGGCRVYPRREMLARLFGCSFNDEGGVYGCHLVGEHLGGKTVTLVRARPMAMLVHELPLTDHQQVWPRWIWTLYGAGATDATHATDADRAG
jgi:Fe-S-cluster containining protein